VADPRRLNVALTRARRGLVVVASPSTLAAGSSDWAAFVKWVEGKGAMLSSDQLPLSPWQEERVDPFGETPPEAAVGAEGGVVRSGRLARTAGVGEEVPRQQQQQQQRQQRQRQRYVRSRGERKGFVGSAAPSGGDGRGVWYSGGSTEWGTSTDEE
jgi:hypothetical protein